MSQERGQGLTQIIGHKKRCRPAFDGQSNSNRMEPFALHAVHIPSGMPHNGGA